mmetsp:Transcript_30199/g.83058  ORF Transcript_30199/g.83058 Transcript_30199/m.83058 type:complete len:210 (-) Transcript_30199:390-1019(-)
MGLWQIAAVGNRCACVIGCGRSCSCAQRFPDGATTWSPWKRHISVGLCGRSSSVPALHRKAAPPQRSRAPHVARRECPAGPMVGVGRFVAGTATATVAALVGKGISPAGSWPHNPEARQAGLSGLRSRGDGRECATLSGARLPRVLRPVSPHDQERPPGCGPRPRPGRGRHHQDHCGLHGVQVLLGHLSGAHLRQVSWTHKFRAGPIVG